MKKVNAVLKRNMIAEVLSDLYLERDKDITVEKFVADFFIDNRINVHEKYLIALARDCYNDDEKYNFHDFLDEYVRIVNEVTYLLNQAELP